MDKHQLLYYKGTAICVYIAVEVDRCTDEITAQRPRVKVGISGEIGKRRRTLRCQYGVETIYEIPCYRGNAFMIEKECILWLASMPTANLAFGEETFYIDKELVPAIVSMFPHLITILEAKYPEKPCPFL